MKRPFVLLFAGALAVSLAAGCATGRELERARASLGKAKDAGAEKIAPYEYYQAEEYLKLADHETAEGDAKQARSYAEEAERFSAAAIDKAAGGAK